MLSRDDEVIVAQCTPRGAGAIALIRLSGCGVVALADRMSRLASGAELVALASHTIHYGSVTSQSGDIVDNVLFLLMHGPRTFTGQDTVEITCHNNQFVVEQIIECAIELGARLADRGEFAKRAVLNGKLDLLQAEAVNDLIHAATPQGLRKSLGQLEGTLSSKLVRMERELIRAIALCEASFEFIEDEAPDGFRDELLRIICSLGDEVAAMQKSHNLQQQVRNGARVVIVGAVNAGKSSLFNALLGVDRAIVTKLAGTTRDTVEAGVQRDGFFWTLVDTAGLRQTGNVVEREGIKRTIAAAQEADIVVLVFDGSRIHGAVEWDECLQMMSRWEDKLIVVRNKSDLVQHALQGLGRQAMAVSSKTGENVPALEDAIRRRIVQIMGKEEAPFLLNQRQYKLVMKLDGALQEVAAMLDQREVAYELISTHLNDAASCIAEMTGKSITEKALDAVFREFCVGK